MIQLPTPSRERVGSFCVVPSAGGAALLESVSELSDPLQRDVSRDSLAGRYGASVVDAIPLHLARLAEDDDAGSDGNDAENPEGQLTHERLSP